MFALSISTFDQQYEEAMGVDYVYVNHEKLQFFHCGLFGQSSRFEGIGRGYGSRALAILLSDRSSWKNDRLSVVADSSTQFDEIFITFANIDVEIGLMLIDIDGV